MFETKTKLSQEIKKIIKDLPNAIESLVPNEKQSLLDKIFQNPLKNHFWTKEKEPLLKRPWQWMPINGTVIDPEQLAKALTLRELILLFLENHYKSILFLISLLILLYFYTSPPTPPKVIPVDPLVNDLTTGADDTKIVLGNPLKDSHAMVESLKTIIGFLKDTNDQIENIEVIKRDLEHILIAISHLPKTHSDYLFTSKQLAEANEKIQKLLTDREKYTSIIEKMRESFEKIQKNETE